MKKIGQALLGLLAALVTAGFLPSVSAGGDVEAPLLLQSGREYSTALPRAYDTADYRIEANADGELILEVSAQMVWLNIWVTDSEGKPIQRTKTEVTLGSAERDGGLRQDSASGTLSGTAVFPIKKGSYSIRFYRRFYCGSGQLSFTATYPDSDGAVPSEIECLSVALPEGSSVQLGADVNGSSAQKVTWTSSSSSVVSVSSSGKINCRKKGTAVITAKLGNSEARIKIKVS